MLDHFVVGIHLNDSNRATPVSIVFFCFVVSVGSDINGEIGDESGWDVSINDAGDSNSDRRSQNDGGASNQGMSGSMIFLRVESWDIQSDIDGENGSDYSGRAVSLSASGDRCYWCSLK